MPTQYTISTDALPKDSGGQKFLCLNNIAASDNAFALPMGIGASNIGIASRLQAYLGIATATAGSTLVDNAPAGAMPLWGYTTNPSRIATNNFVPARGDQYGAGYITALSTVTCAMSGSRETFTVASGTLYKILVAGADVNEGASVVVFNGATSLANFVFSQTNETLPALDLGLHGTCFGSLIFERRNVAGGTGPRVFVTANYNSIYSQ